MNKSQISVGIRWDEPSGVWMAAVMGPTGNVQQPLTSDTVAAVDAVVAALCKQYGITLESDKASS